MFLTMLWRGEIPLVRTYWVFGVFFYSLLAIPGYFIVPAMPDSPDVEPSASFVFGMTTYAMFVFAYTVFISVAFWRSARNFNGSEIWAVLARVMVVIGLIQAAFRIVAV